MKTSTCTRRTVKVLGIENGIRLLTSAGYDALDLSLDLHADEIKAGCWQETAKRYRTAAAECGIVYNQAHAPFGGGKLPDGRSNYAVNLVPIIPDALRMAAAAGVETVVVHPINLAEKGYLGHEDEHFQLNLEFFRRLAPVARELGIKIAIENLWLTCPTTGAIVNASCADPREHIALFDALAAPDVFTLCLDVGHSALVGREPQDVVRALGHDRLGVLHIHDVDYKKDLHTLPYLSRLDWEEICRAIGEIDYAGYLTLEADSFIKNTAPELLPDAVSYMAKTARYLANKIDSYRK